MTEVTEHYEVTEAAAVNYSDDGGDNDYRWSDNTMEDVCEEPDQDEDSETYLGGGVLRICAGKRVVQRETALTACMRRGWKISKKII